MGFFDRFKKTTEPEKKEEKKTAKKPMAEKKELKTLKLKSEAAAPVLPGKEKEAKVKKAKKEDTKNAYKVLVKPLVTEKSTNLVAANKYAFKVTKNINKIEVKKAILSLYGVEPMAVNIINVRGKKARYGRTSGKRENWKKAIVTLKPKDKIEIYEGV